MRTTMYAFRIQQNQILTKITAAQIELNDLLEVRDLLTKRETFLATVLVTVGLKGSIDHYGKRTVFSIKVKDKKDLGCVMKLIKKRGYRSDKNIKPQDSDYGIRIFLYNNTENEDSSRDRTSWNCELEVHGKFYSESECLLIPDGYYQPSPKFKRLCGKDAEIYKKLQAVRS